MEMSKKNRNHNKSMANKPTRNLSSQKTQSSNHQIGIIAQQFSSPIPPPEIMANYKAVDSTCPDRILMMSEKEQDHAHKINQVMLSSSISAEKRGQIFAFVLSLTIVCSAVYLIADGKQIAGTLLAGSTLIGLAYIFITGRKKDE